MSRTALDGNAAAGILFEAFGREMTTVVATCRSCGQTAPLAETVAYVQTPGTVLRCRQCSGVLLVVVQQRAETRVFDRGVTLHL